MSYLDKVTVGGATYDIADSEARADVAELKSAFILTHGKNYLDTTKNVEGYLNSNGTIHANPSGGDWLTTDFIDVSDCETIIGSRDNNGTRASLGTYFALNYDSTKAIVGSQISNLAYPYTIPDGVTYIRFSYHANELLPMIEKGNTRTAYEAYKDVRLVKDAPYATVEELKDGDFLEADAIQYEQIDGFYVSGHGKNYLNTTTNVNGYLNSNGTIHSNPSGGDWVTTDFIDVSDCTKIIDSSNINGNRAVMGMYFLLNYDSSKTIVGSQTTTVTTPYTIPDGVKYIRFSYHSNVVDPMIESGTTRTAYEAYRRTYEFENADFLDRFSGVPRKDLVVNHWQNVRWAVFGDSLTEKNIRAEKSYYDYIKEELGCTVVNYGASGTGYARTNSNFMVRMLNVDPTKFDVLTIFGSFNDAGAGLDIGNPTDTGTSTLCGCINTTIDNFYSVAPYKVIGLVTPCPWVSITPDSAWGNNYADAIIAIGKLRGIPVLDLFRESGIRPWAGEEYLEMYYKEGEEQDTGVHPNSMGHKVFLYPHFREFLKKLC